MTSAGVLMLMLSKPLIRLTPLYSGILSKWTMCLKFQLTMQRQCEVLARAAWPSHKPVEPERPQAGLQFLVFSPKLRIEVQGEGDIGRVLLIGR